MRRSWYPFASLSLILVLLTGLPPKGIRPSAVQAEVNLRPIQSPPQYPLADAIESALSDDAWNVEFVGQIGGAVQAVAIQGSYAYVGIGPRVAILDVSDPAQPTLVGQTAVFPELVEGVAVADGHAYVANHSAGLRIIDVSEPSAPFESSAYESGRSARDVAVSGSYAYVTDNAGIVGSGSLRIIDVSNPYAPVEIGFCDTPGDGLGAAVAGDYAYVADDSAGLRIIDVSNPYAPVEIGFYDTPDDARGVAVVGDYAYVADDSAGLRIIDVSNPYDPVEIGFYDTPGWARGVAVAEGCAYIADSIGGLRIIDISNPYDPVEIGFYDTPVYASDVAVVGGYAYVADDSAGVRIIDVSNPAAPWGAGLYDILVPDWGVAVAGDYAYVASYSRLRIIDVSSPTAPSEVGFYDTPGRTRGVAVVGDYAYVASAGLCIVDISDPHTPFETGFYDTPGDAWGVAVVGDYAYVADNEGGLSVIDVSDPTAPSEAGFSDAPPSALDVAVEGDYAYVANTSAGLRIVDVSNPYDPVEIGFYDTANAIFVAVEGNYAYLLDNDNEGGLRIIDVSNPHAPFEAGIARIGWDPAVAGDYVFGLAGGGLGVVDVSNPYAPFESGFYDTPGYAWGVAVAGPYIHVAAGDGGLFILRFTGAWPGYAVSGHVSDSSGFPLPDTMVSTTSSNYAITDANGDYTIANLFSGTYTLTPSKSGYTFSPTTLTVTVPPDATGQDFTGSFPSIPGLPPIVFVHGWLGVPGGDCGLPQPNAYFERLDDDLRNSGYHVEYAILESSPCYTPPLVENVGELKQAIGAAKAATGQEKVILIAHSMGGLVSRAYIEDKDYYEDDVQAIFTLGSPHLGVPVEALAFLAPSTLGLSIALWCATSQPVVCEFSQSGMWIFNRNHPNRDPDVDYYAIGGDAPLYPREPLAVAFGSFLPYGDDGAVETSSATGLSGQVDRWITDEVHGSSSGPRNYFIRDGGQSVSYNYCLKPVLVDKTTDTCGTFGDLRTSAELATTPAQRTPFEYGVLLPGQSIAHQVSLEGGETLFASRWQTGTIELTLLDPVGQAIDPQYAVDHPDIVTYVADDLMVTYHFPDAIAGSWNMVLDAISVPAEGSAFTSFAAFDSPLALTAATDRIWYAPEQMAFITATLAASPASAVVTATLSYADGLTDTAELLPLGGDVYGINLTLPDAPGYVDLRVAATGTTAIGAAFERGLAMAFQIAPASADLTDTYTDIPVPRSPGSALYQALAVTVGIESTIAGRLGLSADLIDDQGNLVAHAYSSEEVAPGLLALELLFDGDDIYASRRDGPYTLTQLLLTDQTGVTLAVLEADEVYITAAYDYRSFSRAQVYLPLVLRSY